MKIFYCELHNHGERKEDFYWKRKTLLVKATNKKEAQLILTQKYGSQFLASYTEILTKPGDILVMEEEEL
jgi:hypothetical protein